MNQTLLLQKTGEQMELLIKLEIKEHVDHAGLSQQLLQWKEHTKLSTELLLLYLNNNLLIVTQNLKDVMGALHKMLSSMRTMLKIL
jgi:hypothetical protein